MSAPDDHEAEVAAYFAALDEAYQTFKQEDGPSQPPSARARFRRALNLQNVPIRGGVGRRIRRRLLTWLKGTS